MQANLSALWSDTQVASRTPANIQQPRDIAIIHPPAFLDGPHRFLDPSPPERRLLLKWGNGKRVTLLEGKEGERMRGRVRVCIPTSMQKKSRALSCGCT